MESRGTVSPGSGWRTTTDVADFLAAAGEFLRRERARNTVLLTVAEEVLAGSANSANSARDASGEAGLVPLFGWWAGDDDVVGGAFLQTPPHPLLLSAMPANVAGSLAAGVLGDRPLSAVNGNPDAAGAFAAAWPRDASGASGGAEAGGGGPAVQLRTRLYRLGELTPPQPPPSGAARQASFGDSGLLVDWCVAFMRDTGLREEGDQSAAVADYLSYGGLTLWEDADGPVSMAGLSRQVAGMVRITRVYTPAEFRGRGYGSAVTAQVSQAALAAGAEEVLLFTDLANPVSNSVYQRIGYQPVEDRIVVSLP